MLLVYSQCPLWWTGESRYVILPHTKRKRKLTKVAASIIYSSFESKFPEETGRMVQWLTARVRTIKNDRELFKKKKNFRKIGVSWVWTRSNSFSFFVFSEVHMGTYHVLFCVHQLQSSVRVTDSPCLVKEVTPLMFEPLKRVGVNKSYLFR